MNVRFCPNCRSLILADFRFCPYCGVAAARGPELSEAIDASFDKLSGETPPSSRGVAQGAGGSVFAKAEESLDRLESDMDLILEELEKEGRHPL